MKKLSSASPLVAALLVLSTVACSDDEAKASGVSSSKLLTALSQAETHEVCTWLFSKEAKVTDAQYCTATALWEVGTQAECEAQVESCIVERRSDEEYGADEIEEECGGLTLDTGDGCEATLGDFERCVAAYIRQDEKFFPSLSCELAGDELESRQEEYDEVPPECDELYEKCPGFEGFAEANQFACDDGGTVDGDWVCDGESDCPDGSDEQDC